MADRIPVYVTAADPILDTGVSSQLRARPEVVLVHSLADQLGLRPRPQLCGDTGLQDGIGRGHVNGDALAHRRP